MSRRVILIRHGETEWALNGRHTGITDIPLTPRGEQLVAEQGQILVGPGKLLDPSRLCNVFVSPRIRAHRTFHKLFENVQPPSHVLSNEVVEWDYGEYEGLTSAEIAKLNPNWNIWTDGCPGGESAEEMQFRVDVIIEKARTHHKETSKDVVIIAHGHFNRAFIARWINSPLPSGTHFNVEPGGVAILGYNSHDEPALNALNLYCSINHR